MKRTFAAAVLAILLTAADPSLAFSAEEKSPNECGKYIAEMSQVLDTLEALVPNIPLMKKVTSKKKTPHLLIQVRENGFLMFNTAPDTQHGVCTTNLIQRDGN